MAKKPLWGIKWSRKQYNVKHMWAWFASKSEAIAYAGALRVDPVYDGGKFSIFKQTRFR